MRHPALLALAAALGSSTACTMTRGSRVGFTLGGAAVATAGALVLRSATDDEDPLEGVFLVGPGAILVVGGLALAALGLTAQEPAEAEPVPTPSMRWPEPARASPPDGAALAGPRAPLPEIATSAAVLRMAQQVRAATSRGNCDAAWATLTAIVERDHSYGDALAAGPVLAPCRPVL